MKFIRKASFIAVSMDNIKYIIVISLIVVRLNFIDLKGFKRLGLELEFCVFKFWHMG